MIYRNLAKYTAKTQWIISELPLLLRHFHTTTKITYGQVMMESVVKLFSLYLLRR